MKSHLKFGAVPRLPLVLQSEAAECGLACLAMVAGYYGLETDLVSLRQRFSLSLRGTTLKNLVDIGGALELTARPVKVELEHLTHLRQPAILHWDLNHFVVLERVRIGSDGKLLSVRIHDPARGVLTVPGSEVSEMFTGIALELVPGPRFKARKEKRRLKVGELLTNTIGLRSAVLQVLMLALALEIFALVSPLFLQTVIDGPVGTGDQNMLTVCTLGFALLMLIQVAIGALRSWVVLYISTQMNLQWMANVFAHLLHLPLSYFEKRHMGDVISRFNSVQSIQNTLSTRFIEAFLDGMLALTALAVLLVYSSSLTLIVLATAAVYVLLRWSTFLAVRRANEEQLSFQAREQSVFLESIRGIQAIKLFNHESQRHARWLNAMTASVNRSIVVQKLQLGFTSANTLLTGVENVAVVWFGARLVIQGHFSVGMLYAFIAYQALFTSRAYALVDKLHEFRMLSLQGDRLADIVLTPCEAISDGVVQASLDQELTIELRDVSFRYSEVDPWVLRHLNLTIHAGQSLAIVGHSGCGKTTLLKLLIGILIPTEGEILVSGVPLQRLGVQNYRGLVGAVMQDDQLFAGTIADNISFFDEQVDMARVVRCAEAASVAADLRIMPMGYQTLIGDMGTSLSGGQKQRLMLARALYKEPRILFLDEATSHLDSENESRVNEAIRSLDLTRVIVAHRRETIASANRVVTLEQGAVVRDLVQEPFVKSVRV